MPSAAVTLFGDDQYICNEFVCHHPTVTPVIVAM